MRTDITLVRTALVSGTTLERADTTLKRADTTLERPDIKLVRTDINLKRLIPPSGLENVWYRSTGRPIRLQAIFESCRHFLEVSHFLAVQSHFKMKMEFT